MPLETPSVCHVESGDRKTNHRDAYQAIAPATDDGLLPFFFFGFFLGAPPQEVGF